MPLSLVPNVLKRFQARKILPSVYYVEKKEHYGLFQNSNSASIKTWNKTFGRHYNDMIKKYLQSS